MFLVASECITAPNCDINVLVCETGASDELCHHGNSINETNPPLAASPLGVNDTHIIKRASASPELPAKLDLPNIDELDIHSLNSKEWSNNSTLFVWRN